MSELPLYFGCYKTPGHYVFRRGMHRPHTDIGRWAGGFDGQLAPRGIGERQGVAALHWFFMNTPRPITALSFWDRSVDKRGGCNSIFFVEGVQSFENALQEARESFPELSFPFDIVPAG